MQLTIYKEAYVFAKDVRGFQYDSSRDDFAKYMCSQENPADFLATYKTWYDYAINTLGTSDPAAHQLALQQAQNS